MKYYTLLSCIESKMIHPTQVYGRFELGQFPIGQAVTVANTLRRTLLSQLPGVAITLVHIENVLHEYESIPGVQEPVLDILSNLKQIVFTSDFEVFQPQIGYVRIKGPAVVRAGDLKLPFFISCVDPDQYITTLTEKGEFHLTVLINSGKHYLNHNPASSTYSQRVALLKQLQMKLQSPTFRKSQRLFFRTWQQQRNMTQEEYLTQVASFIRSKVTTKLLEQEKQRRFNLVKEACVPLLTITKPFTKRLHIKRRNKNGSFTYLYAKKPYVKPKPTIQKQKRSWGNWASEDTRFNNNLLWYIERRRDRPFNLKDRKDAKIYYYLREKFFNTDGYFPVNAFFSPVTKVNYTIQTDEKRAGENACFEIWTNGSIDPRRAIHKSAKAAIKLFLPFQLSEPGTKPYPIDSDIRQQNTRRIRQAEAKKRIKQFPILRQNVTQKSKKQFSNPETAAEFLKGFKKRPSLRRRKLKHKEPKWQWPMRQERRRKSFYTYIQPIRKKVQFCSLYDRKRQLFRVYRRFFPLFNSFDRQASIYNLTAVQYTKLSRLNILNLELPFVIYKFLWQHNVQTIEDLFSIHEKMIQKSQMDSTLFRITFMSAFTKLFREWTGHSVPEYKKFMHKQSLQKLLEEKKRAKAEKAKKKKTEKDVKKAFEETREKHAKKLAELRRKKHEKKLAERKQIIREELEKKKLAEQKKKKLEKQKQKKLEKQKKKKLEQQKNN